MYAQASMSILRKVFTHLLGVSVTHCFRDTFSLIVARSRSNGIHVTPVIFTLRMFLKVKKSETINSKDQSKWLWPTTK